ncbi:MAG: hypothetical protein ACOVP1_07020 [Bacteroidia bacterium]
MKPQFLKLLLGLTLVLLISNSTLAQRKTKFERLMDWGYNIIEGDSAKPRKSVLVLLPIWGVSPETGWQLGLSSGYLLKFSHDATTRPSIIRLNWQITEKKQFSIRPSVDLFLKGNKYNIKGQFVYNKFNENFWGIGNQTQAEDKEQNKFQQYKLNFRFLKQFLKGVYIGPQIQYEKLFDLQLPNNSMFSNKGIAGLDGFETFGLGMVCVYDNRDHVFYTKKGAYIELSSIWNNSSLAGQYNQTNYFLDFRKFKTLWKENVLAVQAVGLVNIGTTPYRQLGTIGNDVFMRGYYNGRFRDQHMFATQIELRKTVWGPFGMVFFGGAGNVGNNAEDLFTSIKPNYGLGIRGVVVRKEHINFRIDMGFGSKGIKGLYLTMAEAF